MLRDGGHDPRAPQAAFSLAVLVVLIALLVAEPSMIRSVSFLVGSTVLAGTTLTAYLAPWRKVPARYLLVLPLLDIVALGIARVASVDATALGGLVVFPALWLGVAFRRTGVITGTGSPR